MANTWGAQTWSFNQWNDLSNVNYTLTGQAFSFSLGNATASGEINQGWGSDTWGYETWGISGLDIQLTGIGLSVSLSSVTTQSDVDDFTVTGMNQISGDDQGGAGDQGARKHAQAQRLQNRH